MNTNPIIAKKKSYQVFFGLKYVMVEATSPEEAFLEGKKTQIAGPFRNDEELEQAAKATKLTGKVYCPDGGKAIFDEESFYRGMPQLMWMELIRQSYTRDIGNQLYES